MVEFRNNFSWGEIKEVINVRVPRQLDLTQWMIRVAL